MKALTNSSPDEGKQQCKQDESPVPLMLSCYGNNPQEEKDEGFRDGGQHLDDMTDGGA